MPSFSSNVFRIALLTLILSAFALRVYKLDAQSLWYDEGVSAIVAQYDLASLTRWTADDIQPPLYYALLAGWGRLAGWGEWSLRFPSVFFGLLIVPLLSALTIRWNRSRLAGRLAGLLAALHPLLLYYSQEARMYSLLVALGIGIGYCVLRIAYWGGGEQAAPAERGQGEKSSPGRPWLLWTVYVFAAVASLYTHYFAAFLLLAINIAYLLDLSHISRFTPPVSPNTQYPIPNTLPWLLANAAVLLLYAPWLGNLFTRLDVDASYWEGSLKLWEALRAIAIRFTSGETVLEGPATRLLWMYGAVTLAALVGQAVGDRGQVTGWQGDRVTESQPSRFTQYAIRNTQYAIRTIQYPLLLLLIPIAAVLTLASFTPKFNARYAMVALPGLLLIWSGGLAGLLRMFQPHPSPPHIGEGTESTLPQFEGETASAPPPQRGRLGGGLFAGLVGAGLLLAGFVQADHNWFFDNAFTKDQWREVAGYLRGHIDEKNPVVLVSGHAWPIWRYYLPEIEPVRLPAMEILDVKAVVDLESSAQVLRPALLGAESVWLVNWQAEVIDPGDVAGLQLQRAGQEEPLTAQFWGLRVRRFIEVDARAISNAPPIQQPFQANFGDSVELLGYSLEKNGDLLLFWRLLQPGLPLPDLYLTGETRTADGLLFSRMGDRRLAAYDFPTFRWQVGQIVAGRVAVNEWIGAGAPPGNYHLRLGVYAAGGDAAGLDLLGANSEPLGKRVTVEISLPYPIPLTPDEDPTTWHPIVDGLFARPILVNNRAAPGESFLLQVLWYAPVDRQVAGLVIRWNKPGQTVQRDGHTIVLDLPLTAGQATRAVYQIPVPLDLPPGDYSLELSYTTLPTRPVELPVIIRPSQRIFDLPALDPLLDASFGGEIRLAGLTDSQLPGEVQAGVVLPLTFIWQTLRPTPTDYTVTAQWLDAEGQPAGQVDLPLPRGSSTWLSNEVVSQIIKLAAPTQPGDYRLIVALYDANRSGLPRLRLPNQDDFVQVARTRVLSAR